MSWTTIYPRVTAATNSVKPSGYLGSWGVTLASRGGANAVSLLTTAGASATTNITTASNMPANGTRSHSSAQHLSGPLAAQEIPAGNWTVAFSGGSSGNGIANLTWQGWAGLFLVNGATGAIRATIFAQQGIGSAGRATATTGRTCYSTTIVGKPVTVEDGDYLCFEAGTFVTNGAGGTPSYGGGEYFGGATAISTDNASNTTPKSFLTAPATIYDQGDSVPGTRLPAYRSQPRLVQQVQSTERQWFERQREAA